MQQPPQGQYNPKETEERILKAWLEAGYYKPEYAQKLGATETFTIIMPPPNANGDLHLGHVSGYAYQDLMGRYNRMKGKQVLLLPGKDHAGIQTEVVYEAELQKQGLTKQQIGRDEFYKQTYEFCLKNAANARKQEQRIGTSADYDRELFTLDPKIVNDVLLAFEMMHKDELIYRGKRLINWCPRCQSALADIDTEYKDSKTPFFYFKYAFTEPSSKALELKSEYNGKEALWKVTQTKGEKISYLTGQTHNGTKILGVGYDAVEIGTELNGTAIGVQMRLDNDIHLVVASIDNHDSLNKHLDSAFKDMIGQTAGAHIILFNEYKDDHFYTNGFVLGTVRPETKFGDTAIACNPDDSRYKDFVGKQFEVQTLNGISKLNFISDKSVDAGFGTGIVKVTPAHAPEDWDMAMRHPQQTMPEKQVIDFNGKLNHLTGKYEGLSVNQARRQMEEDMRANGMLVHLDPNYENRTQICERCKSRIEPLVSHQWFVNTKPLKAKAKELVEQGSTTVLPEGRQSVYLQWMDSREDWCITRQLWWGYRIPVWYKGEKSEFITETGEVKEKIGDKLIEQPTDYQDVMRVQIDSPGEGWVQDPDVLDTWFSSGQWPFVTLQATPGDFERFYPTQVLETGWDILIFWVTRMMMLSTYRAQKAGKQNGQEAPFSTVYLHGLVLDKQGQKMSKSKGNGIDPTQTIDNYGADALRMSFFVGSTPGTNIRLYEDKVASFGRFLNKIWNATKFVLLNLEGVDAAAAAALRVEGDSALAKLTQETNKQLMQHILDTKQSVTRLLDSFQFGVAAQVLYNDFWHSFADIHVEAAKQHLYPKKDKETGEVLNTPSPEQKAETQQVLLYAIQEYLKMLHPMVPFITEELWSYLPKTADQSVTIMYESW